jgi:hypothetical protein
MTVEEHKEGLIGLYEGQMEDAGPFMKVVLTEALRKLRESDLNPKRVEKWVINLEKAFKTI